MSTRKVLGYVFALLIAAFLLTGIVVGSRLIVSSAPSDIKYVDVVVIVLTALSIMITVLGIFVAVLGIVGWATFESKLRDTSLSYFREQLAKGGPLREEFERLIVQISLEGVEKAAPANQEAATTTAQDDEYVD